MGLCPVCGVPKAKYEHRPPAGTMLLTDAEVIVSDGPISEKEIELVQSSWDDVEAALSHEEVGVILYKNIFQLSPEALQLFPFKDIQDLYNSAPLKRQGEAVVFA